MEKHIKLTILTPEMEFYSGEILNLNTQSDNGRFSILANHVSMISPLKPTVTTFTDVDGKAFKAFTSTGVLRVVNGTIEMVCNACEWPENIDIERAKHAKERAEERLGDKHGVGFIRTENAILRALERIRTKG